MTYPLVEHRGYDGEGEAYEAEEEEGKRWSTESFTWYDTVLRPAGSLGVY